MHVWGVPSILSQQFNPGGRRLDQESVTDVARKVPVSSYRAVVLAVGLVELDADPWRALLVVIADIPNRPKKGQKLGRCATVVTGEPPPPAGHPVALVEGPGAGRLRRNGGLLAGCQGDASGAEPITFRQVGLRLERRVHALQVVGPIAAIADCPGLEVDFTADCARRLPRSVVVVAAAAALHLGIRRAVVPGD